LAAAHTASTAAHFAAHFTAAYHNFGIKAAVHAVIQFIGSKATSKANHIGADTTFGAPAFDKISQNVDLSVVIFLFTVLKKSPDLSQVAYFAAHTTAYNGLARASNAQKTIFFCLPLESSSVGVDFQYHFSLICFACNLSKALWTDLSLASVLTSFDDVLRELE